MAENEDNNKKDLESKEGLNDFFSDLDDDDDAIGGDYDEIHLGSSLREALTQ